MKDNKLSTVFKASVGVMVGSVIGGVGAAVVGPAALYLGAPLAFASMVGMLIDPVEVERSVKATAVSGGAFVLALAGYKLDQMTGMNDLSLTFAAMGAGTGAVYGGGLFLDNDGAEEGHEQQYTDEAPIQASERSTKISVPLSVFEEHEKMAASASSTSDPLDRPSFSPTM